MFFALLLLVADHSEAVTCVAEPLRHHRDASAVPRQSAILTIIITVETVTSVLFRYISVLIAFPDEMVLRLLTEEVLLVKT